MTSSSIRLAGENSEYVFSPDESSLLYDGGNHCRVFLGYDLRAERQVAVKVLFRSLTEHPKNIERARREASIRMSHPNLLQMLDFVVDQEQEIYHLISEYVPGQTLRKRLEEYPGGLDFNEALGILDQICEGLKVLHGHNPALFHRGIDPANVMLADSGNVKIMDYGFIKMASHEVSALTTPDDFSEASVYVAPEVVRDDYKSDDAGVDVYSIAVLLYEMLNGEPPFTQKHEVYLQAEKQQLVYKPLFKVNPALNNILKRALSPQTEARFHTVAAFQQAVYEAAQEILPPPIAITPPPPMPVNPVNQQKTAATTSRQKSGMGLAKMWFFNLRSPEETPSFGRFFILRENSDYPVAIEILVLVLRLSIVVVPVILLINLF